MMTGNGSEKVQAVEGLSFLDVLNDCLSCGVIFFDEHGRLASVTPEAIRMLALDAGAVLGQPFDVLPSPLASLVHDALTADKPLRDHDVEVRPGQGTPVTVRVNVLHLAAPHRHPVAVAILNDVTSARRLEFDIGRLDRLANIGVLSASIAHEIKNALVAIKTFTQTTLAAQPSAELGEVAQRELKRIESIVSQMLKYSGPSEPKLGPVRIHEILDHSLRLAQHQMTQKAIRLRREYHAPSDWVNGDDFQLEQAFVNLILNAVEAMGVGGTLTLSTHLLAPEELPVALRESTPPPQLRVTVTDTGAGIAAENLSRVFEPFFTTKGDGTGLGLAITRRILEEHHAAISVESEVNRGASFRTFFAPLNRA
jgi:two-component system, NtrC family, sensor histidine kinase HydH